ERAEQTLEIEVRNPNRRVTDVAAGLVQPGAAWSHAFRPFGAPGTNRAVLELSRLPALDLGKRLGYLIQYPHGCVEQTVSAAFPQLHLDALMDLPATYKADVERNVKAAIQRLRGFQASGGGFGFWPGDPNPNDWASTYAGHFLVEAEKKGYGIPAGMLDQWKRHQRAQAQGWSPSNGPISPYAQMSQAYRLYALALAGAAEMGAMNRLKETPGLSLQARWQLGGAYQLAGQGEAAAALIQGSPESIKPYRELDGTFGTDLRDKAMMLEVLAMMGRRVEAAPLMHQVAAALGGPDVWPTQTTAQALLAMSRYAGKAFDRGEKARYRLTMNGVGPEGEFAAPILQQTLKLKEGEENRFEVTNRGKELLYARLLLEGVPPPGGEKAEAQGISLDVKYQTLKGDPVDPARLEQGQDLVAEAVVAHGGGVTGDLRQLALTMAFPSGWEIRNTRMDPVQAAAERTGGTPPPRSWSDRSPGASALFEYQDFRDDRVHTYFHLKRGEAKTFRFFLNAAYLGSYRMPQSGVEAMYDPGIHARAAGGVAEVHEGAGEDGEGGEGG
ncbi:MAG TPA: hypothetical protein VK465_08805, partial [Fibrobacteria bacterium]|nr:hypothetical protein [Fibrobacteria bacterium]